jgi:hypothetical protein
MNLNVAFNDGALMRAHDTSKKHGASPLERQHRKTTGN